MQDKGLDLRLARDYTGAVRRSLEIAVRGWARPRPLLLGAGVLAAAASSTLSVLSPYLTTLFYVFALMGVAVALDVEASLERALWSRTRAATQLAMLGTALLAALLPVLVLQLLRGAEREPLPPSLFFGCLQLAALALVMLQLPVAPIARVLAFLLTATVIPALFPILRPVLDAGPSFRLAHFPPWPQVLAPILVLVALALASTPSSPRFPREPST